MLRNYRRGDIDSKPNTISFTSVVHAFSKCSSGNGPKKAETILRLMEKSFLEGNMVADPNTVTYSAVIGAWSKSSEQDAFDNAKKIFDEMLSLEKMGRSVHLITVTYASLINALARSKKLGKAKKAHAILEEMEMLYQKGNRHVKPNMYVINSVLSACAFTNGSKAERRDAMSVVIKTF
jgi:pentatricopeptide repeat protein